ncbi:MAG: hypothetical protein JXR34_01185 [Bacteroidales bacterium]|nr:hypothetical protein [Bacteroidales bacterium]
MSDDQLFAKDFIVINKKVSLLNTLSLSNSGFTENELAEISKQPFVLNLSPFVSNQFKIGAYTEATETVPGFYTELFFQAIPDQYLNISDSRWKWIEGQKEIPIVFPGDYLKLYNFGFATSQGLPQISAKTIGRVSFKVKITGKDGVHYFSARIVDVTDKVNTILVPLDFMLWANEKFGVSEKNTSPSMVLIETQNAANPNIVSFIKMKGYETNNERIKNSKTAFFLKIVFIIVSTIGGFIVLLALLMFVFSLEILLLRSKESIKKVLLLGYQYNQLLAVYLFFIAILLFIILLFSWILSQLGLSWVIQIIVENGFNLSVPSGNIFLFFPLISFVFLVVINMITIRFQLRRINAETND